MKLSAIKVDSQTIEHGASVDEIPGLPGVVLQVRGEGNADWRRLQAELAAGAPRGRDGRLDMDTADSITNKLLVEAGIIGWSGIEDDDGTPVPYSKDTVAKWLADPDMRRFRGAAMWACDQVANRTAAAAEGDTKN